MKKFIITLTSLILICIVLIGCNSNETVETTSKELNKNLNILSNTVKRLDTIDNEYLINNDIYNITSQTLQAPRPVQKTEKSILAVNKKIIENNASIQEFIKENLKDEIVKNIYCDENGNCTICTNKYICNDQGVCTSCNKTYLCDSEGNCLSCEQPLNCKDNNCSSCNNECITTLPQEINPKTLDELKLISQNNMLLSQSINEYDNIYNNIDTSINSPAQSASEEVVDINTETNMDNIEYNNTNNLHTTITDNQEDPYDIKYQPRYIARIQYYSTNSNLDDYIEKLSKLYTITADVVEANNTLSNQKETILTNITETKDLNDCILDGKCRPSNNQILALRNYIADIRNTINNIKNCNGNLTNEINKIANDNTGLNNSIEVTNSNYIRILNQIDTRISYHDNAIATLEQIKYLLEDAQNNTLSQLEYEDLNNLTNTNQDNNLDNQLNDSLPDLSINNNQPESIDNSIVTNNDGDNNLEVDTNHETNTHNNNESKTDKGDISDINGKIDIFDNSQIASNANNQEEIVIDDNITTDANQEILTDNDNVNDTTSDSKLSSINNLDTYTDSPLNNVSGFSIDNNDLNEHSPNNQIIENNNDINNQLVENDNSTENLNLIPNENNQLLQNNNNIIDNNNLVQNATSNANRVITQNNINDNDNGNNSYRYDDDGNLYNNTNGFNDNNINNANLTDNNVNTYQYNTIVDTINRGTINNGINNL